MIGRHRFNFRKGGYFATQTPEDAINDEATKVRVGKVSRSAERGANHAISSPTGIRNFAHPSDRHRRVIDWLRAFVTACAALHGVGERPSRIHTLEDKATKEYGGVGWRVGFIYIAVAENLADAAEHGMFGRRGFDPRKRALNSMTTPVTDPGFAEHFPSEPAVAVPVIPSLRAIGRNASEGVRGSTQRYNGYAAAKSGFETRERISIPAAEAERKDESVGRV